MKESPRPAGTVTFLFSDIEDSTELVRRLGNEAFAEIRATLRRLQRAAFAAHEGHEIDTAGDGFFVAFESAREAVQAAIEGQLALAGHDWPAGAEVRVRMGLHTAEPHLGDEGYVGVGVHRASRICDAGHGGQILLSNATAGIVEDAELTGVVVTDLGLHRLKGLNLEQRLFQLTAPGLGTAFGPPRTPGAAPPVPGTGTFLVADLSNHRQVILTIGDEGAATLTSDYQVRASAVVEAHDGAVLELAGDTVLAVFRSASDALHAAVALRGLVAGLNWPAGVDVGVTIAVHSGRWSGDRLRPEAGTALYRVMQLLNGTERGRTVVSATTAAIVEGDRGLPALRQRTGVRGDEAVAVFELALD